MGGLWYKAISSGAFFGIWPLFMKRAGIDNANVATMFMEAIVLAVLLPKGMWDLRTADLSGANWNFLILSAVSAAIGVLIFNGGIKEVPREALGTFIAVVIVIQVIVTAFNQIYEVGVPTTSRLTGFVLVGVGVFLLSK